MLNLASAQPSEDKPFSEGLVGLSLRMSSLTGVRGSTRRKLVVCGVFTVGAVVLLLSGVMMELSIKQVYWAVYSRLHPMRDGAETYGERLKERAKAQTAVLPQVYT